MLCSTCTAIDFKALLYSHAKKNEGKSDPVIQLGAITELIQRGDECELCRLIIDALKERYNRDISGRGQTSYCGSEMYPTDDRRDFQSVQQPSVWKTDEIDKYGFPATWSGHPIICSIRTTFFCCQTVELQSGEAKDRPDEYEGYDPSSILRISRLSLILSQSPLITFGPYGSIRFQAHWDPDVQDDDKEAIKIPGQTFYRAGSGREIDSLVDLSRIRDWLRRCETQHGDKCAYPQWIGWSKTLNPQFLRVIDIKERRITKMPPQGRYLALSYVWGDNRESMDSRLGKSLTFQNLEELLNAGGLDKVDLPNTIQDAMAFTLHLGERYLWVDMLCIIQNDLDDVAFQTAHMDQVYSGAVLTIIAASGDDSHSGLAGMPQRPRNRFGRRVQVSPDGMYLAPTAALSPNDLLPSSAWNSRGWTFQERQLSRRMVIFTKAQTFWRCECATWDEETILEPTVPELWVLPQALGCNDEWDDDEPRFSPQGLSNYITQYSTRKLTFPADALPAFLGVLQRYKYLNQERTVWGLPTFRFDQFLTWRAGGRRRRELYCTKLKDSTTRLIPYPSWSWLGWSGFIGSVIPNKSLAEETRAGESRSELTFYSLMSDGGIRIVDGVDGEPGQEHVIEDAPERNAQTWKENTAISGRCADYRDQILSQNPSGISATEDFTLTSDLPAYDTGRLIFWTSHAEAIVSFSAQARHRVCIDLPDGPLEVHAYITDELTRYVAEGQNWMNDKSETASAEDGKLNVAGDRSVMLNLITISRFYDIGESEVTGKLNIMIVRETPNEPGLWSRLGLIELSEGDWLRLERRWKVILLA